MKTLILAVIVLASGCTTQHYTKTLPDGTHVEYKATGLFNSGLTKGLSVDSSTDKTKTGLKVTSTENQVDGIKETFEGAGAAFGAGLKAAVKP